MLAGVDHGAAPPLQNLHDINPGVDAKNVQNNCLAVDAEQSDRCDDREGSGSEENYSTYSQTHNQDEFRFAVRSIPSR